MGQVVIHKKIVFDKIFILFRISPHFSSTVILNCRQVKCMGKVRLSKIL